MKVTVCELPDERETFERAWSRLAQHVRDSATQLLLLPDMPFYQWFVGQSRFDQATWTAAIDAHEAWELRLEDMKPAIVLGSRPIDFGNRRYDEAFVWDADQGVRSVHAKSRLSDEKGDWDSNWYHSAVADFAPLGIAGAQVGLLIGPELWIEDEAARYGEAGVQVLATPRAVGASAFERWLERGRSAARVAHAYSLSSNRGGSFGGRGWIIAPDGEVLGVTSSDEPFLTKDLHLVARGAHSAQGGRRGAVDPRDPLDTGVPPH